MTYKSPEQKAAEVLIPLGCIHQNDKLMPYTFRDIKTIGSSVRKPTSIILDSIFISKSRIAI